MDATTEIDSFRSLAEITKPIAEKLALGAVERHPVTDRESWLRMRAKDLTASDVASICGCGYRSPAEVYYEKKGMIAPNGDGPMLRRGRRFEASLFETVAEERPNWKVNRAKIYLRSPSQRFGATPDALAEDENKRVIVVQGKVVAKPVFIADWLGGDREGTSPDVPLGYQLQTLSETMLVEKALGCEAFPVVAAWVLDTFSEEMFLIPVARHEGAEQRILEAVANFWEMFDANTPPAIDPTKDHDVVKKLYPADGGGTIDLTGDNSIPALWDERKKLGEEYSAIDKRRKSINTEIMAKIGDNSFALIAGGRKISCKTTTVGERFVDAYSYRQLREVKVR
jgi:predicted phage-related endonuclease